MRPNNTRLMIMVLSLVLTPAALASTWYVNGVSGSNSNNCTSPTPARLSGVRFRWLHRAIQSRSPPRLTPRISPSTLL